MPLETDNLQPELGAEPQGEVVGGHGEPDREGAMAKADLFKLANYSHKLYQQISDEDQLEAWVQAKITKAADYIASVYHFLEYEMKFNEYGKHLDDADTLSEGQKAVLKNRLMEAKAKVSELKKAQAAKKQVEEGVLSGGDQPCAECGGTGVVHVPGKEVPEATKEKVRKYNTLMKASKAAHKRMDANHNGIPDDEEMEEGFEDGAKPGSTFKTAKGVATKTKTGVVHKNTSFSDEEHGEAPSTVKAKSAAEKKADKSKDIKLPKHKGNTWGMKSGEKFGNGAPKAKKKEEEEIDETYGQGVYEGKPSAGLSKAKKSETVKKAKKGEDIGKPGKGFKKVAAAAKKGGAKDPEAVAAAAMWKNIKETTSYVAEKKEADKKAKKDYDKDGKIETGAEEHAGAVDNAIKAAKKDTVKESADLTRMQEQMARLNRNESVQVNESSEASAIRKLTQRLFG